MIDREHDLSITRQAEALNISRGSVYYLPRPVPSADLAIMQRLDRLHLEYPFAGSRMLRGLLAAEGCKVGRRHVKTLMRRMGIEALYRRPRTTKSEPGHKIYPYLLRGMEITRPNQVWAMDITYIPMARGFVYLAVVLDWATRRVLSWRLSITMEAAFCVETLEDALARHGKPEIFNTDQGSQFTGAAFTGLLTNQAIAISMDGKGAWRDNVFVERLWRSVKYEEVYLRAYETVGEARASIGRYLDFYNGRRPHSSLDGSTPDQAYFNQPPIPHGGLTPADAPLIDAEILFRQPGPALVSVHASSLPAILRPKARTCPSVRPSRHFARQDSCLDHGLQFSVTPLVTEIVPPEVISPATEDRLRSPDQARRRLMFNPAT
ncbi:putative transposase [Bradyrhizobium sp. LM6.9]